MNKWLNNIEFAWPQSLWALFIVPILVFWYIKVIRRQAISFPVTTIQHFKSRSSGLFHIPFVCRCIGIIFLILALARPQKVFTEQYLDGEGINIILCMDVSGSMVDTSMIEPEFVPNRLTVSKELAKEFVRKRAGDRIGVVVFSQEGFTACPATTDTNSVITQIDNIQPDLLPQEGTSIGDGIAVAVNRLRNSSGKTKIILLLSDGVSTTGAVSPDTAISLAKAYKIKIYTIGIGSEKEVLAKIRSPFGDFEQSKNLEFNENLLRQIAVQTNGVYFHCKDKTSLDLCYNKINELEKSTIRQVIKKNYEDRYLIFLVPGFIFIFIELVLQFTIFRKFP